MLILGPKTIRKWLNVDVMEELKSREVGQGVADAKNSESEGACQRDAFRAVSLLYVAFAFTMEVTQEVAGAEEGA